MRGVISLSPRAVKPKSVCISEEIDVEFDFPTRDASKLRAIFRVVPPGGVNFTVQWFNEKNQIIVAKGLDIPVISNVLDDGLIVIPIPKEARRGMYAIGTLRESIGLLRSQSQHFRIGSVNQAT